MGVFGRGRDSASGAQLWLSPAAAFGWRSSATLQHLPNCGGATEQQMLHHELAAQRISHAAAHFPRHPPAVGPVARAQLDGTRGLLGLGAVPCAAHSAALQPAAGLRRVAACFRAGVPQPAA